MLDRAHLALLLALEEKGNLSSAADALHLTQSALSHSIRKLEQRFGLKIWRKSGRNIQLTQAGEYLLAFAKQVLPRFEQAEIALKAFSKGRKGKLRIGMECHPCYEWLMNVVPGFLQRWSDVDLDVIQQFRFDGLAALGNHNVDVLITSDPLAREDFVNVAVLEYELMLVVPNSVNISTSSATKPESIKPNFIKPRALADQNLLTFPVEKARLDVFTHFLIPAGVEPLAHQNVETIEVMLQLVASGRGVCTLPDWLLTKYAEQHPIRGVRLGKEGVKKTLYLVHRKVDRQIEYMQDFVNAQKI